MGTQLYHRRKLSMKLKIEFHLPLRPSSDSFCGFGFTHKYVRSLMNIYYKISKFILSSAQSKKWEHIRSTGKNFFIYILLLRILRQTSEDTIFLVLQ